MSGVVVEHVAVQGWHCVGGHGGADGQNLRSLQGEEVLDPSEEAVAVQICACLCKATMPSNHNHENATQVQSHLHMLLNLQFLLLKYASWPHFMA